MFSIKYFLSALIILNSVLLPQVVLCKSTQSNSAQSLSGELEVFYEDYKDGSHKLRHFLKTDLNERFELHFSGNIPELTHGKKVKVKGEVSKTKKEKGKTGDISLDSSSSESLMLAADGGTTGGSNEGVAQASSATFGPQSTLVIMVNFQDKIEEPWSKADAETIIFGEANNFIKENSFHQTSLTGAVTGWYTLPLASTSCDSSAIITAARELAANDGINLDSYNRFIYAIPYISACPFSGVGSVGGTTSSMLLNGAMKWYTVAHEMGHNLGLFHSHALECGSEVIGTLGAGCTNDEYGDGVDIMGRITGHYNAYQKERLGWLDSTHIQTVTSSGTYTLEAYAPAPGTRKKALKIAKGIEPSTGRQVWYYVEFRQAFGFDNVFTYNQPNVLNGVILHTGTENHGNSSFMLDMTPGSYSSNYADSKDPALEVGQSFTDPEIDFTITTDQVSSTSAQVTISLNSSNECVAANPTLAVTPSTGPSVPAGTAVNYQVSITNNDNSQCLNKTYNMGTILPGGWSGVFSPSALTIAPGQSLSSTLTITSSTTASDNTYNIQVNTSSDTFSANKVITYTISTPTSNNAPVANNDSALTEVNTPITIQVINNDTDMDGDSLSVVSVRGVNGTAVINSDSSITFTPPNNFLGIEAFSYTITDGKGANATASVNVTIQDTQKPSVQLTSPTSGQTYSGALSLAASANDNLAVTKVNFYIDGNLIATDTTAPFGVTYDSANLTSGSHTIAARSYDSSTNFSTLAQVSININNGSTDTTNPVVTITSHQDGEIVPGRSEITLIATATDETDSSISQVDFYADGAYFCSAYSAPFSCAYQTPGGKSKSILIKAQASDSSGNPGFDEITISTGSSTGGSGKGGGNKK